VQVSQTNNSSKLYDANHLYLMKKALIEIINSKITPLQEEIICKEDPSNKNRSISSSFRR
jgi:hypothetical protein